MHVADIIYEKIDQEKRFDNFYNFLKEKDQNSLKIMRRPVQKFENLRNFRKNLKVSASSRNINYDRTLKLAKAYRKMPLKLPEISNSYSRRNLTQKPITFTLQNLTETNDDILQVSNDLQTLIMDKTEISEETSKSVTEIQKKENLFSVTGNRLLPKLKNISSTLKLHF